MPARKKVKNNFTNQWVLNLIIALVVLIGIIFSYLVLISKDNKYPVTQSTPTLNLPGTYQGDLPCADCPGIKETLTLTAIDSAQTQGSYLIQDVYQETPDPSKTQGTWELINQTILKLTPKDTSSQPSYYQVLSNGNLQVLNSDMQKIDSPFNQILIKQSALKY